MMGVKSAVGAALESAHAVTRLTRNVADYARRTGAVGECFRT
jgi:hypothetical protein